MDPLTTLWRFVVAGGPVMLPLMLASLWMWWLILSRSLWLVRLSREQVDLQQVLSLLDKGGEPGWRWSPAGWALNHFLQLRTSDPEVDVKYWDAAVRRQVPVMWRQLNTLLMLAAVAPLLGLLGTVSGMISSFEVIWQFGTGNAQALAGGISEALITTETGLLIAVPGLFAGFMIRRRIRREQQRLMGIKEAVERWITGEEALACYV